MTVKGLENAGSFFCEACCEDKEAEQRSPDSRYCQDCYDFLVKEAKLLGTRRPKWVPKKFVGRAGAGKTMTSPPNKKRIGGSHQ